MPTFWNSIRSHSGPNLGLEDIGSPVRPSRFQDAYLAEVWPGRWGRPNRNAPGTALDRPTSFDGSWSPPSARSQHPGVASSTVHASACLQRAARMVPRRSPAAETRRLLRIQERILGALEKLRRIPHVVDAVRQGDEQHLLQGAMLDSPGQDVVCLFHLIEDSRAMVEVIQQAGGGPSFVGIDLDHQADLLATKPRRVTWPTRTTRGIVIPAGRGEGNVARHQKARQPMPQLRS